MSSLILPRRFTSQPQGALQIDWSNSITRGLVFASVPAINPVDLVTQSRFTPVGTPDMVAVRSGLGLATNTDRTFSFANTPNYNLTNSLSIFWFGVPRARINETDTVFTKRSAWSTTGIPFGLTYSLSPTGRLTKWDFYVIGNGNRISTDWTYAGDAASACGTWDGATQIFYEDGIQKASKATSGTITNNSTPIYFGTLSDGSEKSRAVHLSALVFSRALLDEEVKSLTNNPWQLFRAPKRVLYFDVGGAPAGVTGTISATESGSDVAALSGVIRVSGSINASESGSDAASLAGNVHVFGSLSVSETGADVAAIVGGLVTPAITGSIAASETGSDTASIAGDVVVTGTVSATESGSDTAALTGKVQITGSLSVSETGADTVFINGSSAIITTGAMSASESGSDGCAITGKVYLAGELSAVEGGLDGFAVSGNIYISGVVSATESASDTAAITGTAYVPGTGTLDPATIAAIADAVWQHSSATTMAVRLAEAWGRLGLDPSKPLISGQTEISFGAIVMALTGNQTSSTLTRAP